MQKNYNYKTVRISSPDELQKILDNHAEQGYRLIPITVERHLIFEKEIIPEIIKPVISKAITDRIEQRLTSTPSTGTPPNPTGQTTGKYNHDK